MAETASILSPEGPSPRPRRGLLAGGLDHGRSAARLESRTPGGGGDAGTPPPRSRRRRTTAARRPTRCRWSSTSMPSTATTPRSCSVRTCGSGAYVERVVGAAHVHVWDGECMHAGIRPRDIADVRARPRRRVHDPPRGAAAPLRSWSTWPPATSARSTPTCCPRAGCSTSPASPTRVSSSWPSRPGCCIRWPRGTRTRSSSWPTGPRPASTKMITLPACATRCVT